MISELKASLFYRRRSTKARATQKNSVSKQKQTTRTKIKNKKQKQKRRLGKPYVAKSLSGAPAWPCISSCLGFPVV